MRILVLLAFLIVGCESTKDTKKTPVGKSKFNSDITELIDETEQLQDNLSRDIILRAATSRQKTSTRALLQEIKTALFVLNERPKDQDTLGRLLLIKT